MVHIKERIDCVGIRSQIIKKYFIPGSIATFASAFTGLITNNVLLGIGIGIALGIASLILASRASKKIIDRANSEG